MICSISPGSARAAVPLGTGHRPPARSTSPPRLAHCQRRPPSAACATCSVRAGHACRPATPPAPYTFKPVLSINTCSVSFGQRQAAAQQLDRDVGVCCLPARRHAPPGLPVAHRLLGDPLRQAPTTTQPGLVFGPVRHLELRFRDVMPALGVEFVGHRDLTASIPACYRARSASLHQRSLGQIVEASANIRINASIAACASRTDGAPHVVSTLAWPS